MWSFNHAAQPQRRDWDLTGLTLNQHRWRAPCFKHTQTHTHAYFAHRARCNFTPFNVSSKKVLGWDIYVIMWGCICLCGCYVCAAEEINKKVKTSAAATRDERTQLWIAPKLTASPLITLNGCSVKLLQHRNQTPPTPLTPDHNWKCLPLDCICNMLAKSWCIMQQSEVWRPFRNVTAWDVKCFAGHRFLSFFFPMS